MNTPNQVIWLVLTLCSVCCAVPAALPAATLTGEIVDAQTGQPVAARVYVHDAQGRAYFVRSADPRGIAIPYDKTSRIHPRAIEQHTSVSAHPIVADLPPGAYTVTVERGKEYFAAARTIEVADAPLAVRIELQRWIDMSARGWYSGETHLHRPLAELPTLLLAEDLNVALPLTYWVSQAFTAATTGNKSGETNVPDHLIEVDRTHVIWPRNTEYEIFTIGGQRHTLGAIFALNHRSALDLGVPPVGRMAALARREGALFDLDKPDWPWAMALVPAAGVELFELANNHLWRTEFGFRNFNTEAPPWLLPPRGGRSGDERQWLRLTLGHYYTLLNCGFPLVPSAGTASGVHPVPVGFSRVYVHLPDGFSYDLWLAGLRAGRSFVTTGPMLLATANGRPPGESFTGDASGLVVRLAGTITSAEPIALAEIVHNGRPLRMLPMRNARLASGAFENTFEADVKCDASGWLAVRCYADGPAGRVRFAHTAPWKVNIPDRPLVPSRQEVAYLAGRVRDELARSREILPAEAVREYERSLAVMESVGTRDVPPTAPRQPQGDDDLRFWLENMLCFHGYTLDEVQAVTGLERAAITGACERLAITPGQRPPRPADGPLVVLPYPGGRHPRIGFLEGAVHPQRETKLSVFTPWDPASYVVVDLPEAVFSNLGLTYLAHTHVPTIWERQSVALPPLEWNRRGDGSIDIERRLPNGIAIGARAVPRRDGVFMELWLTNGTPQPLTNLRVQNCVMLAGASGFAAQTNTNKVFQNP